MITGLENQSKRTAKKTLIEWTEAANSAFENLKELCTSTPILAYPHYQLPFILHTDSSSGLGAVLYQKQEGKLRVIAFASRSASKTEANYPAHKLYIQCSSSFHIQTLSWCQRVVGFSRNWENLTAIELTTTTATNLILYHGVRLW